MSVLRKSTVEVRRVRDDDELYQFTAVLRESLRFPPIDKVPWLERYDRDDIWVALIDGKVVGGAAVVVMGQWFGGKSVPMAGINGVGVLPEYRGRGAATGLMRTIVADLRQRGLPLSGLYPATQPVYRRAGYEQSGIWHRYRLPIHALERGGDSAIERIPLVDSPTAAITDADLDDVRAVYDRYAAGENGLLDRRMWGWSRIFRVFGGEPTYAFRVRGEDGATEGYVVFSQAPPPVGDHRYALHCRELVATTADAWRRLVGLLADHGSMAGQVFLTAPPNSPLHLRGREQFMEIVEVVHWMTRIVDVSAALEARGYLPGMQGTARIRVRDEVLPENAGEYVIEVRDGAAAVERVAASGSGAVVDIDIRGLAALYTGFATASNLARCGLAEGESGPLTALSALFSGPAPWLFEIY